MSISTPLGLPSGNWIDDLPRHDDTDSIRGLLYSVVISVVFVWFPVAFVIFGTSLLPAFR
jgi:hypothetical protein